MLVIDHAIAKRAGGTDAIAAEVQRYRKALADHAFTVDVPAPPASPLVEEIVRRHGGDFEVAAEKLLQEEAVDAWTVLRSMRNDRLRETDWTQLPDAPTDKARWAVYRQQLRDLPANTADPAVVVWPKRPDDADTKAAERELDRAARTVLFDGKNKP